MPKPKQISFKADLELAERIERAVQFEEIPVADFVRKLFRYAIAEYEAAGSLHALRLRAEAEEKAMRAAGKSAKADRDAIAATSPKASKKKRPA